MRTVLLGPPGAGKGTQAARLAAAWKVPHVSTGDLLRQAVAEGTALGRKVRDILAAGRLVDDALMAEVIGDRLGREDCARGFVLDGYPRTERQCGDLDRLLSGAGRPLERVILIDVPEAEVKERLQGRRTCSACQAVTHLAQGAGSRCASCGGELVVREDDRPETVERRLEVYRRQTQPLVERYRRAGLLAVVDGRGTPEEVHARLLARLQTAPR
jgi:adenylate kinase